MRFLIRMKVRNATVTTESMKKMDEMAMIASGSPSGVISLADGSTSFVGVAIAGSSRL
jgi:hypothetical protein